ncbi:TIGR00282 family metallophosphoesterase [Afifella pfennigii]|uniref:TIGR00282 family metallophosphoesterase n=1 Tax=Afifella pfennigii TaxID=209897 RepID=UPI00047A6452|nr:TIGR00282 family metallophosphoesterase [Afifella pfennigii]
MRLLFLGDVVGRSGRKVVKHRLPELVSRWRLDFVVINGENAAGGFGITEPICQELLDAGADCVTSGNHVFDQKEALVFAARQERFLRPLNYPPQTPGRGANIFTARNGARVLVVNLMGQLFMPALDDPVAAVVREIEAMPLGRECDAIVVDFHAEATSEKQVMGAFLDGKASLVVGTHTHVPTADHRIQPGGTAYMSDVGMCGDYDSIIGMQKDEPLHRAMTKIASGRLGPAMGEATLSGIAVELDDTTGLATKVSALRLGPHLEEAVPTFWDEDR